MNPENPSHPRPWRTRLLAFAGAALFAIAWGSLVQTHFNLQALARLGVDIPLQARALMSAQDLFGFGPIYAGVVLAAWLPAFGGDRRQDLGAVAASQVGAEQEQQRAPEPGHAGSTRRSRGCACA